MKSSELIRVELQPADTTTTTRYLMLTRNGYHELPVLLLDPLDESGTVMTGMWLNHNVEEAEFCQMTPTPAPATPRHPSHSVRRNQILNRIKQFFSR